MSLVQKCKITGAEYTIEDKEIEFCKTLGVPLPTICSEERIWLLMAFRNEWKLYPRKCDATGEEMLSAYHPHVSFPVYKNDGWWGDGWDGLEYGMGYNFSEPFFKQVGILQKNVPREGTSVFNSENCVYNSHIRQSRNCYLNSLVAHCEDISYFYWMTRDTDCIDCMNTNDSTLCYECIDATNCYHCFGVQESSNCRDCCFSCQLQGCSDCIFRTNLVNKDRYIFNKPYTKGEFRTFKEKLTCGSSTVFKKERNDFVQMCQKTIHRYVHNLNCETVTGDHLLNSKDCIFSFDVLGSEDCIHAVSIGDSKDVYSSYSVGWLSVEIIYREDCYLQKVY